jgi:hypothetical protein
MYYDGDYNTLEFGFYLSVSNCDCIDWDI